VTSLGSASLRARLRRACGSAPGTRAGIALLLFAITVGVYWPARGHGWLDYDDPLYVTENPAIRLGLSAEGVAWAFSSFHGANWFPLTRLSWLLDHELFGWDPAGFHTTSVLLHAAAAALLFAALARATGRPGRSAFVAAVFALHPLHVESVAWVAARKDVLSGLFFAAGLAVYAGQRRGGPGAARLAAVSALLALGLLAKPVLVTFPCVLLLLDEWPLRRLRGPDGRWEGRRVARAVAEKLPLFALVAAASAVTVAAQRSGGAVADLAQLPLGARLANALVSYAAYAGKAFWPTGLAVFYPHPEGGLPAWQTLGAALLVGGVTVLALLRLRRGPWLAVGWLWYVGMLVPVIGLVQVGSQARADRYTYLPLVGLALAVAWAVPELARRVAPARARAVCTTAAVVAVGLLAATTSQQLRHWKSSQALFEHALAVTERNATAHTYLGEALLAQGEDERAIAHWLRAARLSPVHRELANNLAWVLATHPDPERRNPFLARRLAERALQLSGGDDPAVLDTLAAAQAAAERFDIAARTAERALRRARAQGNAALAEAVARRLALYRAGRPYRESPAQATPPGGGPPRAPSLPGASGSPPR